MSDRNQEIRTSVIVDVITERRHQIDDEGFDAEHDDRHIDSSMSAAAAAYAFAATLSDVEREGLLKKRILLSTMLEGLWPSSWSRDWFKLKDRRRDLIRAAALIIAEIERLDRRAAGQDVGGAA